MYKYTVESVLVKDMVGNIMSLNVDWGVARPEEKIRNAGGSYYTALEGWRNETSWGVGSWDLGLLHFQNGMYIFH